MIRVTWPERAGLRRDEPFQGVFEGDRELLAKNTLRIPRAYWKVVVAAFVLVQFELLEADALAQRKF